MASEQGTLFGQPRGLFVLFVVEACERFSYYGMKALLVLYLVRHFLLSDKVGFGTVAAYGSLVYLLPVIGGFLADRYIGFRRAVYFGAVLLCIGHFLMMFEGEAARVVNKIVVRDEFALNVMFLATAFIIMGVGFLKPSISNMVGQLYEENDSRRDQGFTIFYMGINFGALTATLLCGYLGEEIGWAYGFGLAGVIMLVGLAVFHIGHGWYEGTGEPRSQQRLKHRVLAVSTEVWIYFWGLAGVVICWFLMQYREVVGWLLAPISVATIAGILVYAKRNCSSIERDRLLVLIFLAAVSVVFWALFEQMAHSLVLFAERNVALEVFGASMTASQSQFFNPFFIIVLAPIFALLWRTLSNSGFDPSTPMKFALGVVQSGLAFLVLVIGISFADSNAQLDLMWLVLTYLLLTTGELCLSPIGLSAVTRLSAPAIVGVMMGAWFLASSGAAHVSGILAGLTAIERAPGEDVDALVSLPIYEETFLLLGVAAVVIGVVLMLVSPFVRRRMHEDERYAVDGSLLDNAV